MHGAKLHEAGGVATMLGIHRGVGQQPLEGADWLTAERICFHLTKAAGLFSTTRRAAASDAIARELLNRLRIPVYLVDVDRRVVMTNNAAQAGRTPSHLRVGRAGQLECTHRDADQKIALALADLDRVPPNSSSESNFRHMAVRITSHGGAGVQLLCLDAMRPKETMSVFGRHPLLMIAQHQLGVGVGLDPFFLASAFDLTPAEAMVASAIAASLSQKEIPLRKGVSLHTVQTQLKSIHSKLGVHKSTELVALLHSFLAGAVAT